MGASNIEVYPEQVAALRADVAAIQQSLSTTLTKLQGKLPGGSPWGGNDGGKEFGESYGPSRDNAFAVTKNAISALGTIADGLNNTGKLLDATDAANAS